MLGKLIEIDAFLNIANMFNTLSELGEGSFGDVHLVENKQTK